MSKYKLQETAKLLQKKYRISSQKFLIEGWKMIEEALHAGINPETVFYIPSRITDSKLLQRIEKNTHEIFPVSEKEMNLISDTVASQGVVAVISFLENNSISEKVFTKKSSLSVVVEELNDPGNLGTIIRTCDWFGVDALVIGKNSVDLYNPKVVRATMGSLFHVPILCDVELKEFLLEKRKTNFTIYSTELSGSRDLRTITFSEKSIILIGSESHGISEELSKLSNQKIMIPRFGKAESLNAAMACGIILSHAKFTIKK